MRITSLHLLDFRNYRELSLDFHPQVTQVVGDNAQGKTNILESIYYLGRASSFRTSKRSDLVKFNQERAIVRIKTSENDLFDEFAVEISKSRQRFLQNGKPKRRPGPEWLHCILFAPEDTILFKASPSTRRDYLDVLIDGVDANHQTIRRNYKRVMQQRNRELQQSFELTREHRLAQLVPWTEQLIHWGAQVVDSRRRWVSRLNEVLPEVHGQFAVGDGRLQLGYEPHVNDAEDFANVLTNRQDEELARGITVAGPQRDELTASLGEHDVQHFGSQGQHRSVVISLKLAEVTLAREATGRTPILLLDDVASELDPARLSAFIESIKTMTCQIILTTVNIGELFANGGDGSAIVTVQNGAISP